MNWEARDDGSIAPHLQLFLLTVGAALVIIVGATLAGWLATTRLEPNIAENRDAALLSAAFGVARHSSLLASVGSCAHCLLHVP